MPWESAGQYDFINRETGHNIRYQPADADYDDFYWLVETQTGKTLSGAETPIGLGLPAELWQQPESPTVEAVPVTEKEENVTDEAPGAGHNSGTVVAADRLRSIVDRIERLNEERKALGSDIKDIFAEAKAVGFDTKVIRTLIQLRHLEPAEVEERETLLDLYRRALGM